MHSRIVIVIILPSILFTLIAAIIVTAGGAQATDMDVAEMVLWAGAYDRVLTEVLNGSMEGKWVYADPTLVSAGTTIDTWYGTIDLPAEKGGVFFIDDAPMENWAHPCRYIFIDYLGDISIYDAFGPPKNLEEWKRLTLCDDNSIEGYESDIQDFKCVVADDRIIYWQQKRVDDVVVEGDFILYIFNRSTQALITKVDQWKRDVPDQVSSPITPHLASSPMNTRQIPGLEGVIAIAGFFGATVFFRRRT